MTNYAHDENNNRIETLSKEQVYALLAATIQQGQLPVLEQDTAFVTMIKSIVDGKAYKIGFCTQAQYNELEAQGQLVADALYIITDDETYNELATTITNLYNSMQSLQTALTNGLATKLDKNSKDAGDDKQISIFNEDGIFSITSENVVTREYVSLELNNGVMEVVAGDDIAERVRFNVIDALTIQDLTITNNKCEITESGLYIVEADKSLGSGDTNRFTCMLSVNINWLTSAAAYKNQVVTVCETIGSNLTQVGVAASYDGTKTVINTWQYGSGTITPYTLVSCKLLRKY